tara:strand:+ start:775 stop:1635 length:861 start_codon:yes stop_codon:yes gene_type:complete
LKKKNYIEWDLIINSKKKWLDFRFDEIWEYKDLLLLYVKRNIVTQYKQTVLGPLWIVFPPLLMSFVFTIIFGRIIKISTEGLPPSLFYMSGIVMWNYFSTSLNATSNSLAGNIGIFSKVYFPRIIIPLATIISGSVRYFIQLIIFTLLLLFFIIFKGFVINFQFHLLFLLPIIILMVGLQGLGIGLLCSALTVKYRDLRFLISFSTRLLMYASPIIFPLSIVPEKYKYIIILNPMTSIIEFFRYMVFGGEFFNFLYLLYSIVFTFFLFLLSYIVFNYIQKDFIDYA